VARSLEERWHTYLRRPSEQRSIAPVLFLTVLSILFTPIAGDTLLGRTAIIGLVGVAAVMALTRTGAHGRIRSAAVVAVVIAMVSAGGVNTTTDVGTGTWQEIAAMSIFTLLLIVTPTVVLLRLLLRPRITLDTLAGALTAYLQIGIFFGALYRLIDLIEPEAFFTGALVPDAQVFQYFSFITLTTVGYGDLTPATPIGQTVAMSEAIFGQVFLVTVVALTVSNLGKELPHRRRLDERVEDERVEDEPEDAELD
jgi:hypothetical protein